MLRERPKSKSKVKDDPKRVSSVAFKKIVDDEHSHKRSTTAEKPKKKISKKKRQQQERRKLDEEERRIAEIEEQRRVQLESLRLEELKKLTKEETERLQRQFPEYYQKCERLSALTLQAARREKKEEEWERYLRDSEMIDVDKEREVHRLVASLRENLEISFSYDSFEKWIGYLDKVMGQLSSRLQQSLAQGNREKSFYYSTHLTNIEQAIREKAEQYVRFNCDNFQKLLEVKNRQRTNRLNVVKEKYLPILSLETEKNINEIVFKKSEERYKYEIARVLVNTPTVGLAIWFNLVKVGYRPKPLSFPSLNVEFELPRTFIQNSVVVSCLKHRTSRYSSIGEFFSVGDVVQFLVYPFFPLPRINNKFILKRVTEVEVKRQGEAESQPFVATTGSIPSNISSMKRIVFEGKENEKLAVKIPLPPNFYLGGSATTLTVGLYVQNAEWTKQGISNITIDQRDMSAKFETSKLLPMSILLPKCTDVPYKSFFLRCSSTELALLDIETRRGIKLQFEIERNTARLTTDGGVRELSSLVRQDLSPGALVKQLSKRGVMVQLSDDDTSAIPGCKIPDVENKVLEDITFTLSGFAFKSTEMNGQCSPTEIVLQAKSHLDFQSRDIVDDLHPWHHYLFNINKCGILNPKLKTFKEEFDKGATSHINMERVVRQNSRMATQQLVDRFSWVSLYPAFLMNVRTFVKQLRLFSTSCLE